MSWDVSEPILLYLSLSNLCGDSPYPLSFALLIQLWKYSLQTLMQDFCRRPNIYDSLSSVWLLSAWARCTFHPLQAHYLLGALEDVFLIIIFYYRSSMCSSLFRHIKKKPYCSRESLISEVDSVPLETSEYQFIRWVCWASCRIRSEC